VCSLLIMQEDDEGVFFGGSVKRRRLDRGSSPAPAASANPGADTKTVTGRGRGVTFSTSYCEANNPGEVRDVKKQEEARAVSLTRKGLCGEGGPLGDDS
jgi:hypothetical protein